MSILKPMKTRQPLQVVNLGHNDDEEDTTEVRRRRVNFAGVNKIKEFNSDAESIVICDTPAYEEEFTASSDSSQIIKDLSSSNNIIKKLNNEGDDCNSNSDMVLSCSHIEYPTESPNSHHSFINSQPDMVLTNNVQSRVNLSCSQDSMDLTELLNPPNSSVQNSFMQETPCRNSDNYLFNQSSGNALKQQCLFQDKTIDDKENKIDKMSSCENTNDKKNDASHMSITQPNSSFCNFYKDYYSALSNSSVLAKTLSTDSPVRKRHRLSDLPGNKNSEIDVMGLNCMQKQFSCDKNTSLISFTNIGTNSHLFGIQNNTSDYNKYETGNGAQDSRLINKSYSGFDASQRNSNISTTCAVDKHIINYLYPDKVKSEFELNSCDSSNEDSSSETINLSVLKNNVMAKKHKPKNSELSHQSTSESIDICSSILQENEYRVDNKRKLDQMRMDDTEIVSTIPYSENFISGKNLLARNENLTESPDNNSSCASNSDGINFNKSDSHMEMENLSYEPFVEVLQLSDCLNGPDENYKPNTTDFKNSSLDFTQHQNQNLETNNVVLSPPRMVSFRKSSEPILQVEPLQQTSMFSKKQPNLPIHEDELSQPPMFSKRQSNLPILEDELSQPPMFSKRQSNVPILEDELSQPPMFSKRQSNVPILEDELSQPPMFSKRQSNVPILEDELFQPPMFSKKQSNLPVHDDELSQPPMFSKKQSNLPIHEDEISQPPIYNVKRSNVPVFEDESSQSPIITARQSNAAVFEDELSQLPARQSNAATFEDESSQLPARQSNAAVFEDELSQPPMFSKRQSNIPMHEDESSQPAIITATQSNAPILEDKLSPSPIISARHSDVPIHEDELSQPPMISKKQSDFPIFGHDSSQLAVCSTELSTIALPEKGTLEPLKVTNRDSSIPITLNELRKPPRFSNRYSNVPVLEDVSSDPSIVSKRHSSAPIPEDESSEVSNILKKYPNLPLVEEVPESSNISKRYSSVAITEDETSNPPRSSKRNSNVPIFEGKSSDLSRYSSVPRPDDEASEQLCVSKGNSNSPIPEVKTSKRCSNIYVSENISSSHFSLNEIHPNIPEDVVCEYSKLALEHSDRPVLENNSNTADENVKSISSEDKPIENLNNSQCLPTNEMSDSSVIPMDYMINKNNIILTNKLSDDSDNKVDSDDIICNKNFNSSTNPSQCNSNDSDVSNLLFKLNEMFTKEPVEQRLKTIEIINKMIRSVKISNYVDELPMEQQSESNEYDIQSTQPILLSDVREPGKGLSPLQRHNKYFMEDLGFHYYEWTEWTKLFFNKSLLLTVKVPWEQFDINTPILDVSIKSLTIKDEDALNFCSENVVKRISKEKLLNECKKLKDTEKLFHKIQNEIKRINLFYQMLEYCVSHSPVYVHQNSLVIPIAKITEPILNLKVNLNIENWENMSPNDLSINLRSGNVCESLIKKMFSILPSNKEKLYNFVRYLEKL